MTRIHRSPHRLAVATLVATLVLGFAGPARAGELDVQLLGWGRETTLAYLHKHNADKSKTPYQIMMKSISWPRRR